MIASAVVSRHRLPEPYRSVLVGLWLLPPCLMFAVLLIFGSAQFALLHPLTLLFLCLMSLPALYVWREGIDVTAVGVRVRMGGWHYRPFARLRGAFITYERGTAVFTLLDENAVRVVMCPAAHLTECRRLVALLRTQLYPPEEDNAAR